MRQRRFLGIRHVLEQRSGRSDAMRKVLAAEAGQVPGTELCTQQAGSAVQFVMPWRATGQPQPVGQGVSQRLVLVHDDFGRLQALDFAQQSFGIGKLG